MVTVVLAVTAWVVIRNATLVALVGTVTVAGTLALGLLLLSVTTVPPLAAGPFSVTVFMPVICIPPTREVGYSEIADNASGATFSVAVCVAPP
jgi:hypothetical protein